MTITYTSFWTYEENEWRNKIFVIDGKFYVDLINGRWIALNPKRKGRRR